MGANGIYFDDVEAAPNIPSHPNWQSYTELAGLNLQTERITMYTAARDYLRSQMPGAKVCTNTATWDIAKEGDCFLAEYAAEYAYRRYLWLPGDCGQDSLQQRDLRSSVAAEQPFRDEGHIHCVGSKQRFRRLMASTSSGTGRIGAQSTGLSAYYIVANENTRFGYQTERGWVYYKTDEFAYLLTPLRTSTPPPH